MSRLKEYLKHFLATACSAALPGLHMNNSDKCVNYLANKIYRAYSERKTACTSAPITRGRMHNKVVTLLPN